MKLVNVYKDARARSALYELLCERPRAAWISHKMMPTRRAHRAFVASRPFYRWYLITQGSSVVGAIEMNEFNEIGISIFKQFWRKGYAKTAIELFLSTHKPLPAIPAVRNDRWLANMGTRNYRAKGFWRTMGFKPIQETWAL